MMKLALALFLLLVLFVLLLTATRVHADVLTADLAVAYTDTPRVVGLPASYTLVVTNHGPDAATGVAFQGRQYIPSTDFVIQPGLKDCAYIVTADLRRAWWCRVPDLAVGAQFTVTALFTPLAVGTYHCAAGFTAATHDPTWQDELFDSWLTVDAARLFLPFVAIGQGAK